MFSFYFQKPTHPLHKRKDFILLGLIFFVYAISYGNSISTIFLMNEPFCWGSRQIGYVSSAFVSWLEFVCYSWYRRLLSLYFIPITLNGSSCSLTDWETMDGFYPFVLPNKHGEFYKLEDFIHSSDKEKLAFMLSSLVLMINCLLY